jgi:hypothetical protein
VGMRICWLDPCDTSHLSAEYVDVGYHIDARVELQCFLSTAHESAIRQGVREAGDRELVTTLGAMYLPGSLTWDLTIRGHADEVRFTVPALGQMRFRGG